MTIAAGQRFTKLRPCPICGGRKTDQQHKGQRCWGYLSSDEKWAHCTRDELAGNLQRGDDQTYAHVLAGLCNCGAEHGPAPPKVEATTTTYVIKDASGLEIATHWRFDYSNGKKEVFWKRHGTWGLKGLTPGELPLYGSERLAIYPTVAVVIVEGEKSADRLRKLGVKVALATYGTSADPTDENLRPLVGRYVVLSPDHDLNEKGHQHMAHIAARLRALGTPAHYVRCLSLVAHYPELPPGGDFSDYLELTNSTLERVTQLLREAPVWPSSSPVIDVGMEQAALPLRSDGGNAIRLVRRYGDQLRWCIENQEWYVWGKGRWLHNGDGERAARTLGRDIRSSLFVEADQAQDPLEAKAARRWALQCDTPKKLDAMLRETKDLLGTHIADFDADGALFNVKNGTIELATGTLRPHRPEDYITLMAPVEYDPAARSALWEKFIFNASEGNQALSNYLQALAGYCLLGRIAEEVVPFIFGETSTGKSTFLEALSATFGEYAAQASVESFLFHRNGTSPRNDLARLAGVRLVTTTELPEGRMIDEAMLKGVTGDRIVCRFLNKEFFEYRPKFKVLLVGNYAPLASPEDEAVWRRLRRVPFRHNFVERDPTVKATLCDPAQSGAAILAWAVQGYQRWLREGLTEPDVVKASTAAYRDEVDPVTEWLVECTRLNPTSQLSTKALHSSYLIWDRNAGPERSSRPRLAQRGLTERLMRRGFKYVEVGREKARCIVGLELIDQNNLFSSAFAGGVAPFAGGVAGFDP